MGWWCEGACRGWEVGREDRRQQRTHTHTLASRSRCRHATHLCRGVAANPHGHGKRQGAEQGAQGGEAIEDAAGVQQAVGAGAAGRRGRQGAADAAADRRRRPAQALLVGGQKVGPLVHRLNRFRAGRWRWRWRWRRGEGRAASCRSVVAAAAVLVRDRYRRDAAGGAQPWARRLQRKGEEEGERQQRVRPRAASTRIHKLAISVRSGVRAGRSTRSGLRCATCTAALLRLQRMCWPGSRAHTPSHPPLHCCTRPPALPAAPSTRCRACHHPLLATGPPPSKTQQPRCRLKSSAS